jgi:hypothetical protein
MKKISKIAVAAASYLSFAATTAFADFSIAQPPQVKFTDIGKLIGNVVSLAMIIAALITFVFLIWGGVEWIISGGEKAGTEAARNRITNAFIGLFVVFAAWAIIKVIETFFGICIVSCPVIVPTP